jgi:hypothetical protein
MQEAPLPMLSNRFHTEGATVSTIDIDYQTLGKIDYFV